MKLDRILASTDLSPRGNDAVRRAAELAAGSGAMLHIIHALPQEVALREVLGRDGAWVEGFRAGTAARLQALVEEIAPRLRTPPQWTLASGRAQRVIADAVGELAPDLLVVGAHGEGAGQPIFLGGTAAKLLGGSTVPVLVVRIAPAGPYRSVLVATDMGPRAPGVLAAARAAAQGAALQLLHAYHVPHEARLRWHGLTESTIEAHRQRERETAHARLRALASGVDPQPGVDARHGHPNTVVLEAAKAHDLVVVGRHSGTAWVENLLGSTPRFLAHFAPCDVLIA